MASGITVNGVPLEEHLADENATELTRAVISESAQPIYRAPASKPIRNHSGARSTSGEVVYVAGQKATKVIICGSVFQYAAKAPFPLSGMSADGAIIATDDLSQIECHECGFWAQNLSVHARHKHDLTPAEYKDRHGLARSTSLLAPKLRDLFRDEFGAIRNISRDASAAGRAKILANKSYCPRFPVRQKMPAFVLETRNLAFKCRAQLTSLIKNLGQDLGRMPSFEEISKRYTLISNGNRLSYTGIKAIFGANLTEIAKIVGLKRTPSSSFINHRPPSTHCKYGHELSGDNLSVYSGRRGCKACHRRQGREYRQRQKKDSLNVSSVQSAHCPDQAQPPSLSA